MTENLSTSDQELFEEILARGIEEGVSTKEAYNQLVSDIIEEHRRVGELNDDQDLEGDEDAIQGRWPDYKKELDSRVD